MSESKSKSKVTREQLEQAAKLRDEGATWNEIREATGTKLGSGAFQRHWAREGIDALPSHAEEFKTARAERHGRADRPNADTDKPSQPSAQAPASEGASVKASRSRTAKEPAAERAR